MSSSALSPEMERLIGLLERSRRLEAMLPFPEGTVGEALDRLEAAMSRAEHEQGSARLLRALGRPRYVFGEWDHIFSEQRGATETRWVFDRSIWRLVALQVREKAAAPWQEGFASERTDVEDSLTSANQEPLWNCEEYGLAEANAPPEWAKTMLPRMLMPLLDEV